MAVFSPTNAKVHFKAYDGNFTDTLGNATITQHNSVSMASTQTLFGQESMYMSNFNQAVSFDDPSLFDVGTGDYTVGFWFYPTQFTSWDRLFVTDPYQNASPLRIYNHNGSINVYAESTTDGTNTHDYMMGYYLGNLSGVNNWYHIMVKRDSGTTKLYINGVERSSSTMSYSIANSNTVVLGADTDRGMTGVKGYIQDFFWTEDAVSFTQADFTPATAEPITFHSGNPSISSFSTSATSADDGDSVTLSWSVSGETKLELLKYVGGILSTTEDVLGLSSKLVTITETVSYKLRATNDNSAVDSASVQITLNGGIRMAKIPGGGNGLVIQKDMVKDSSDLAAELLVVQGAGGGDVALNTFVSVEYADRVAGDAAISSNLSIELVDRAAADASEASARAAADTAEESARIAADAVLTSGLSVELVDRAAADAVLTSGLSVELVDRAAADAALQTALTAEINATNADVNSIDTYLTDFVWDGTEKMTIGGAFNMVFETGLSSGDPCSVTITAK